MLGIKEGNIQMRERSVGDAVAFNNGLTILRITITAKSSVWVPNG